MAAAYAAAFFSRLKELIWACGWIIASFTFSNVWSFALPQYTFGYAFIDLALLMLFFERWRATDRAYLIPLVLIQIAFMGLHVGGTIFEFSFTLGGAPRSHEWIETVIRNRLFELSNLYIILCGIPRSVMRGRRIIVRLASKLRGLPFTAEFTSRP